MTAHSTSTDVRGQLEKTAGITPSDDWLTACQAHLRLLTNEESADAVLHQVLYADLRDVVRSSLSSSGSNCKSASPLAAVTLLRKAMQDSMRGDTRKATLPATFAILVQVEELLDVSKNADARYAIGPASVSNPTPVGNQKARCLKMYLSDGHRPPIHLVAMETAPIPNLSVNSLAGIKVLLKGPLTIRCGMVQLHSGCATVLGGSVADLVAVQKKALEQAQRLAGIGVDPTVKALIWNKDAIEDERQQEEGEGSSGDVTAAAPRALPVQQQALPPHTMAPPLPPNPARIIPRQPLQQQPLSAMALPRQTFAPPPPEPFQSQQPQRITSSNNRAQQPPTTNTVSQPSSSNTASSSSSTRSINPYARSSSTTNNCNPMPTRPAVVAASNTSRTGVPQTTSCTPKENRSSNLPAQLPPPSSAATTTPSTKVIATQSSQESSTSTIGGIKEPLSFDELMALVKRMVQDRQLYEEHVDKIFVVPAKMKGAHTYFNIEKKKKTAKAKKSKGGEKYEYVMNSHFTGPTASKSELVTVVAAGDMLRPHFTLPPGDMRKLSRENRQQSQKYAEEGGRKAMVELSTLRSWEINLYATAEDFFVKPPLSLDGEVPILRVLKQSN